MIIRIVIIFIFLSISNLFVLGEYNIFDVVPTHLYRKFDNVKEDIFPEDIRIKIILRKIIGTLLYSIDRRRNQLILSLGDEPSATLEIEFRKKTSYASIASLCGCGDCYYVVLDLVIQIRAQVYLRCNGKKPQTFPYDNVINVNGAYPIIYSPSDNIITNEAHLWLVNTPYGQGIYPNYDQLNGCIFNVWYKNEAVNFTEIIGKVDQKCPKICDDNICHGGVCIETFNGEPICNCTETFMSGNYCNDTLYSQNYISVENKFKFTVFKLSWNSSSQEIFSLSNSHLRFRLRYYASFLVFEYNYTKEPNFLIKSILTKTYKPNKNYVCVVSFYDKYFQIQFLNNLIWHHSILFPSHGNLENEVFTSMSLRSGSGNIGIVYKTFRKRYDWINIGPHNRKEYVEKIEDVPDIKVNKEQLTEKNNSNYTMIGIIVVSFVVMIVIIILLVIIFNGYIKLLRSRLIIDFGLKTWSDSDKIRTFQILQKQFFKTNCKKELERLFTKMMKRICGDMVDNDEIITKITNAYLETWKNEERIEHFNIIEKTLKSSLQTNELLNIMIPSKFQKSKFHHDQNIGKVISCLREIFKSEEFHTKLMDLLKKVLKRRLKLEPKSSTVEDKESNKIDKCMDILSKVFNTLWTDKEGKDIMETIENSLKPKKVKKELLKILFGMDNMRIINFLVGI